MLITWYIGKYSQNNVMSKNSTKIKFDTDPTQNAIPSYSNTWDKYSSGQTMQHTKRKPTKQITTRK